jgi:RNA polymerase sigma factor (sigma-70 family)
MVQRESDPELDVWVARLVRKTVRSLLRSPAFSAADREDLEQELTLEVLRRLPRFDPQRGRRESFLARVVESRARTLLRRRSAPCRDWRRRASLDELTKDQDGRRVEVWRTLDADLCRARRGIGVEDGAEGIDLRIDVATAMASLPPDLRRLCAALIRGSARDASRSSGTPRGAVRGKVARIRAHFERCGLGDYASRLSPSPAPTRVLQGKGPRAALHGRSA